jgi:hypothetical protein
MRWHFYLGLLMIALGEFLIFHPIQPLTNYLFFQCLWFGFIVTIDSIVYERKKRSLLVNNFPKFLFLLFISALFWWFFELINFGRIQNWDYTTVAKPQWLMFSIAFSTIVPAVFESAELLMTTKFLKKARMRKGWKITSFLLIALFLLGIIIFSLLFLYPKYSFGLTWLSTILILDPINYKLKFNSLLGLLKKKKLRLVLILMFATLFCGFFWEFWNYWAPVKWIYNVPYVGLLKIFEMPILGYTGYLPFGLELYVMYNFVIGILGKKKLEYQF